MQKVVLLLHGIFDTGKVFAPLEAVLQRYGFETLAPDLVPNDGSAPISQLAESVAHIVDTRIGSVKPLAIVGFSMGGIVARYYLQELSGYQRVAQFVSISSPHRGSLLAHFAKGAGARELCPDSLLLRRLAESETRLQSLSLLSLWTPLDLMIVPASSSVWPIARNEAFWVPAHPLMLKVRTVHQTVLNWLLRNER
ncbi:MAG: alpha/beta fold hydrolase [Chloroherpetonaceae bacterium]|nr:alpha/beta fold hydrolase [Chloroherpetonaceae bacterium]MCS7210232.1 alpha/beta fold hydrolase [Chloroherpetonaceae bacterium]MDW8019156.1 alpha/beta fold hydrolase [Chloroherpetonaceae bacterium]MDW8466893.1 alpha/beta fold hydrolase [Chloroherpetonaceae bacterium]